MYYVGHDATRSRRHQRRPGIPAARDAKRAPAAVLPSSLASTASSSTSNALPGLSYPSRLGNSVRKLRPRFSRAFLAFMRQRASCQVALPSARGTASPYAPCARCAGGHLPTPLTPPDPFPTSLSLLQEDQTNSPPRRAHYISPLQKTRQCTDRHTRKETWGWCLGPHHSRNCPRVPDMLTSLS